MGIQAPRRVLAGGAMCVVAASMQPTHADARLGESHRAWAATAVPRATLELKGKGFRTSALSADGRVALVADARGAYVFRASSDGSWRSLSKPAARLRVPKSALANLAGLALSSDGTTALVAAGSVGRNEAAVYVFHVGSPRAWRSLVRPRAKLTNAREPGGFGSGVALSSDGTTVLVGEPRGADVFHVATADSWRDRSTPTATLVVDATGAEEGGLGVAVALSAAGTTALIGATDLSTLVGAAYIFRAFAPDDWMSSTTPDAVLTDGWIGMFGDDFGGAVALAPDGRTALVGAPELAPGPAGAAYLFQLRSGTVAERALIQTGSGHRSGGSGEVPGWSVALSGEGTALVGAPSVSRGRGAADVVDVAGPAQMAELTDAAGPPGELFGASVELSSDGATALVSSARAAVIFARTASAAGCYVPFVEGDGLPAAKRAVEATHCRVGEVTRLRTSSGRSARVIRQRPESGKRLVWGARVDLSVR